MDNTKNRMESGYRDAKKGHSLDPDSPLHKELAGTSEKKSKPKKSKKSQVEETSPPADETLNNTREED